MMQGPISVAPNPVRNCCAQFVRRLSPFARGSVGAVPWLTWTMPQDLMNGHQFPTEVAQALKWSCLVCSVPVAFDGVPTRGLVDAPGRSCRR